MHALSLGQFTWYTEAHMNIWYVYFRKDDDLAKLQENVTWKNSAEKYKEQIDTYQLEVEIYKRKAENLEGIVSRLEKESKDHQDKEEQ